MNFNFENLNRFFEKFKTLGFFNRIFGWASIKSLSYDAYEEFKKAQSELERVSKDLTLANTNIELLKKDIGLFTPTQEKLKKLEGEFQEKNNEITELKKTNSSNNTTIKNFENQISEKNNEIKELKIEVNNVNTNSNQLKEENTKYKQTEDSRRKEYEKNVEGVNAIREHLDKELQKVHDAREKEIADDFERKRQTWSQHEQAVENAIHEICKRNTIEYHDKEKVPFKGKPDNTIKICDEFVIFDSKSPASDDLENFPTYIKLQSESVKKYIKEQNVKKDIFLVIPSNTLHVIKQFTYNMGDYNVFVIAPDSLEPIILGLKKIEEYEFAKELTPEERENICRIIGKFAHLTKRRIQIDYFFSQEFLSILSKCKADLPEDILKNVIEFEKAEKLNPPQEKRAKQILTPTLIEEGKKIKKEAEAKEIIFPDELSSIKQIPLSRSSE